MAFSGLVPPIFFCPVTWKSHLVDFQRKYQHILLSDPCLLAAENFANNVKDLFIDAQIELDYYRGLALKHIDQSPSFQSESQEIFISIQCVWKLLISQRDQFQTCLLQLNQ